MRTPLYTVDPLKHLYTVELLYSNPLKHLYAVELLYSNPLK